MPWVNNKIQINYQLGLNRNMHNEAKWGHFIGQKLGDRRRIPAGSSWGRNPLAFLFKSEWIWRRIREGEREPPPPPLSPCVFRLDLQVRLGLGTAAPLLTGNRRVAPCDQALPYRTIAPDHEALSPQTGPPVAPARHAGS